MLLHTRDSWCIIWSTRRRSSLLQYLFLIILAHKSFDSLHIQVSLARRKRLKLLTDLMPNPPSFLLRNTWFQFTKWILCYFEVPFHRKFLIIYSIFLITDSGSLNMDIMYVGGLAKINLISTTFSASDNINFQLFYFSQNFEWYNFKCWERVF